jgi:hypothetical protein
MIGAHDASRRLMPAMKGDVAEPHLALHAGSPIDTERVPSRRVARRSRRTACGAFSHRLTARPRAWRKATAVAYT